MTTRVVQLEVGPMANFSYIIADETNRGVAIVDPSWDLEKTYTILENNKWRAIMIINTHNHFDHVMGNEQIASFTGAQMYSIRIQVGRGSTFPFLMVNRLY